MNQVKSISLTPSELYAEARIVLNSSTEKGLAMALNAAAKAESEGHIELAVEINIELANLLRKQGQSFECIDRLNHAYRLSNDHLLDNKHLLAEIYREYGSVYIDGLDDYATGLEYFYRCLSLNNPATNQRLYPSIAYAYICTEQYDQATHFLELGEKINIELQNYQILSFVYENKAEMYVKMDRIEEAIKMYELGIETANKGILIDGEFEYAFIKGHMLTELSRSHIALGHFEKIHPLLEQVYPIADKYNLVQIRTAAALVQSKYYLEKKEYNQFKKLFEEEIELCSKHSLHTDLNTWYEKMINLCELLGDFKNGLKYSKLLIENRDLYANKTKAINITKVLENKEREIISLHEKNREMHLQKKEIEQFAYIVAHDLKTPLSNISNFGGLFKKNCQENINSKNKEYLDIVMNSAHQMHKMLDELLRYTSVEKISGKLFPTDIEKTIRDIQENIAGENLEQPKPEIYFENLPKVVIHPKHIFLVLDRMVRNSIKFCKKETTPKIRINISETDKAYNFSVSDNGIGIKEEFRHKVFDLFKQLDKVEYDGTGMGLALSKKIVNTYGGKIMATNSDLGGVTFEFDIPKRK